MLLTMLSKDLHIKTQKQSSYYNSELREIDNSQYSVSG